MKILLVACMVVVLFGRPGRCTASTVWFNDADRAPNDLLEIGGIAITPFQTPTVYQPSTTLGQGLGVAGPVGASYSFDQELYYLPGEQFPSSTVREDRLHFSLAPFGPATFTSMTIVPYLTVSGPGGTYSSLPTYGFSLYTGFPYSGGGGQLVQPESFGSPTVIDFPYETFLNNGQRIDSLDLYISSGMGGPDEGIYFYDYRQDFLSEEQTIRFGFTLVSLSFDPIPEPSAGAVLAMGSVLAWLNHRRRVSQIG